MGRKRGSVTVEFTLVGIPIIFTLVSIVDMSLGMWIYHSQTYAVAQAARYTVVHGQDCTLNGNTCTVTVGNIASAIANTGVGLSTSQWDVTLVSASGSN